MTQRLPGIISLILSIIRLFLHCSDFHCVCSSLGLFVKVTVCSFLHSSQIYVEARLVNSSTLWNTQKWLLFPRLFGTQNRSTRTEWRLVCFHFDVENNICNHYCMYVCFSFHIIFTCWCTVDARDASQDSRCFLWLSENTWTRWAAECGSKQGHVGLCVWLVCVYCPDHGPVCSRSSCHVCIYIMT